MNRRYFIKAAAASAFLPQGIAAAGAATASPSRMDWFFYDDRFAEAVRRAQELPAPGRTLPVRGDVTDIWNAELARACDRSPLTLHGVTTESFYFCLKVLTGSKTGIDTTVARVDRDLFLWTIRTNGGTHTGTMA